MTTHALLQSASAHMTANYNPPPFVAARGAGATLWDTEGRAYLDFAQGIGVNALGHAHPVVVRAITAQATALCHTSNAYFHAPYIALCAKLAALTGLPRVYLSNSGTESVEAALKLARRYFYDRQEPRTEFVATINGFHGRTLGALSVTGQKTYREGFGPLLPGVSYAPYNDLAALRERVGPNTAAVILEPIQGNGGVLVAAPGYLAGVQKICRDAGCLLILDEVQTGMGRTGTWFAYEHDGVTPDILCLAKALGGGLPLGAMLTGEELAKTLQPGVHASTFGGNPVACAAGLATIAVIETEGLLARANAASAHYRQLLQEVQTQHPSIQEVRGRGLLVGLAFAQPVKDLQIACRKHGLLTTSAGANVLRLFPPLLVSDAELARSIAILVTALKELSL